MLSRKIGAVHRAAPAFVPRLADISALSSMTPSAGVDWQSKLVLGDPLGNDVLGNCVPCAQLRCEQLIVGNAMGSLWTPTTAESVALYQRDGKYVPGDPSTDTGTQTDTAMQNWCSQGDRLGPQLMDVPHWVSLDPLNQDHQKIAVDTLGCVLLTLNLPRAAMQLSEWTITPDGSDDKRPGSEGGHRVMCGRHDDEGMWLVTWGMQMFASPAFLLAYCIAADAIVSRLWLDTTGRSPAGLDFAALLAQAAAIGR